MSRHRQKSQRMIKNRHAAPTSDWLTESVKQTALDRMVDALRRGEAVCCFERDDGLGYCSESPESISHASWNVYRHDFKPAGRLLIGHTIQPKEGRLKLPKKR